jgi:putative transposase
MMCQVLGVSRSGFYAWRGRRPSARQRQDWNLTAEIRRVHTASRGIYGSPRVTAELRDDGWVIGENRVARLMRVADLHGCSGRRPGPRTTTATRKPAPADLVNRKFTAAAPNLLWLGDITYLRTWEGWLYLAMLKDAFSRAIVGYATAEHLRLELPLAALTMALKARRPRPGMLIHHTDRGSQYLAGGYTSRLTVAGITASAARSAYDNAMAESFFGTIKNELIYRRSWPTRREAALEVFRYINWYNHTRRHSSLGQQSPIRYEQHWLTPTLFTNP